MRLPDMELTTPFPPNSSLAILESMMQRRDTTEDIMSVFDILTDTERGYLYEHAHVNSRSEFQSLLEMRNMHVRPYEEQFMTYPEYVLMKHLLVYIPPIIIILGTFGNAFSFVVLRRRAMVKISSYLYLASLAVADSLVLYVGLLRLWLGELTGFDFHHRYEWACKLSVLFGYMVSDVSVWLIIAVTVERYIVVCFPLKASTMCNTNRAKKVIAFLVLLMFCINLHFFFTVQLNNDTYGGDNVTVPRCEAAPTHEQLVNEVWPWVDAFIYSFLPFITILVLNVLIIVEVVEARTHRQYLQNTPEHHYHQQMRRRPGDSRNDGRGLVATCRRTCGPGEGMKLTIMLLTVSFTFLLTTLPMNICLILTAFWNQQGHGVRQAAQFRLAKTISELLMYVNHSINFFLYCATGQKFRQQIVHLLGCKRDSSYNAWNSIQTEESRFTSSVRNGHNRTGNNQRHLLLNAATDDPDFNSNGADTIPLRTKV